MVGRSNASGGTVDMDNYVKTTNMTAIPANADLNDYKTVGTYCCSANATIPTLSNCPVTYAFKLIVSNVVSSASPTQEITTYLGDTFVRTYQNWTSTWTAWTRVGNTFTISSTSVSINKPYASSKAITAPTVSGYTFFCWIGSATAGWVGATYIQDIRQATTNVWVASSGQTGTGDVLCFALYIKN